MMNYHPPSIVFRPKRVQLQALALRDGLSISLWYTVTTVTLHAKLMSD